MLTYGLSRSPTRAHFQNIPNNLSHKGSAISFLAIPIFVITRSKVVPILIPVHDTRHNRVRIGARANYEQYHQEQ